MAIKEWLYNVNDVSNDMISWALNFQDKREEKKQAADFYEDEEGDKEFILKRKHKVTLLFFLLCIMVGILLGYWLGVEFAENHYLPLLETACDGCICLN